MIISFIKCSSLFGYCRLTANGAEREEQRVNDSLRVNGVGFLISSNTVTDKDTNFHIQIKDITALPNIDKNVLRRTLRTKQE